MTGGRPWAEEKAILTIKTTRNGPQTATSDAKPNSGNRSLVLSSYMSFQQHFKYRALRARLKGHMITTETQLKRINCQADVSRPCGARNAEETKGTRKIKGPLALETGNERKQKGRRAKKCRKMVPKHQCVNRISSDWLPWNPSTPCSRR
jgi:hypothetical protein